MGPGLEPSPGRIHGQKEEKRLTDQGDRNWNPQHPLFVEIWEINMTYSIRRENYCQRRQKTYDDQRVEDRNHGTPFEHGSFLTACLKTYFSKLQSLPPVLTKKVQTNRPT